MVTAHALSILLTVIPYEIPLHRFEVSSYIKHSLKRANILTFLKGCLKSSNFKIFQERFTLMIQCPVHTKQSFFTNDGLKYLRMISSAFESVNS